MAHNMEDGRNQPFKTSTFMFPKASRSLKLQDKPNALKSRKSMKQLSPDPLIVGSKTLGSYNQKQGLYRDGTGVEELVKYMSNVPAYLQLLQKGDSNQEKALNVGVLDWGRLQKWTHNREPVMSRKGSNSPSSYHAASSSSTDDFSCPSHKSSNSGNSVTQRNQWSLGGEEDCAQNAVEERSSSPLTCFLNLEIASMNSSVAQTNLQKTGSKEHDRSENKLEKNAGKSQNINHACSVLSPQEVNTCMGPARDCGIQSPREKGSSQSTRKLDRSKPQIELHGEHSFLKTPPVAGNKPRDCAEGHGQLFYGSTTEENHRFCYESTVSEIKTREMEQSRFTGLAPNMDQCTSLASYISYSCPLPSKREKSLHPDANSSTLRGSKFLLPDEIHHHLQVDAAGIMRSKGTTERRNDIMFTHPKLLRSKTPERSGMNFAKAGATVARESSPGRSTISTLNRLITSSSLRGRSLTPNRLKRTTCSDNSFGNKMTTNNGGRQSPLRRMLDPLLKAKALNHHLETAPESRKGIVRRLSFSDKHPQEMVEQMHSVNSSNPLTNSSSSCEVRKSVPSTWMPTDSKGAVQNAKQETSRSQALLRLAWKNGHPLYTFSMNDADILAATRKKSICGKADFECIYTFYYVHELKKKNGGWKNQGSNKNKKQALVSNVVGKMNVSCFRSLKPLGKGCRSCLYLREFILLGPELRPISVQPTLSLPDSELVAIVTRSHKDVTDNCSGDLTHSPAGNPSNMNLDGNNDSSIVAILPSEVHGLSESGTPSPLIDRWKTGGFCDCGGWDAGCSLTILTDSGHQSSRLAVTQSNQMLGAELFVQGGAHGNGPVFRLVALREELYAVEFDPSIALLQAFSVCVAILHSKQPQDLSEPPDEVECTLTGASPRKRQQIRQGSAHGSYVPHHPPLSPVGRA